MHVDVCLEKIEIPFLGIDLEVIATLLPPSRGTTYYCSAPTYRASLLGLEETRNRRHRYATAGRFSPCPGSKGPVGPSDVAVSWRLGPPARVLFAESLPREV